MRSFTVILAFSLLLIPNPAFSQSRFSLDASPDAWLVPLTVGIAGAGYLLHAETNHLTKEDLALLDPSAIPVFDRPATRWWSKDIRLASDIALGLVAAAPIAVLTEFSGDFGHLLGMYAMTMTLAVSVPQYTKALGRIRPLAYNDDVPLEERTRWDVTRSFFSGHATISTAAGVFIATVYETYRPGSTTARALWVGGVGMGMVVGSMRVISGMHFPSDVAVGMIVGAAIGYAIPHLHKRDRSGLIASPSASPPIVVLRIPL